MEGWEEEDIRSTLAELECGRIFELKQRRMLRERAEQKLLKSGVRQGAFFEA